MCVETRRTSAGMAWWRVALDLCRSCNRARAGIFCERDGGVGCGMERMSAPLVG